MAIAENDPRWASVLRRDAAADGRFWYSVDTTGVYCRPSCGARRALARHVRFHDSVEAAERAGFRPCRRCRPDQEADTRASERVAAAKAALEAAVEAGDAEPTLAELGAQAGLSPFHFQRLFKRHAGLSPRQYAAARRAERMRAGLASGATVTAAIYEAGYGSSSRFYERADAVLGMTATAWRKGGAGTAIRFAVGQTSLGAILVAATDRGICAIDLGDDPQALVEALERRFPAAELVGGDAGFENLVAKAVGLVEAPGRASGLTLDVDGTAFQRQVWQALQAIPPGDTASYAEIARRLGHPGAVRAVAGACAANPVALAIPCHRVVRGDGGLAGYRWGIERKRALLEREQGA